MLTSEGFRGREGDDGRLQGRIAQEAEDVAKVTGADEKNWVCWEIIRVERKQKGKPKTQPPFANFA